MSRKRDKTTCFNRPENTRDERKGISTKDLLTFSLKDLDQKQPINDPQSIESWHEDNLLKPLLERLKDLSKLTRVEAVKQKQIKIYGSSVRLENCIQKSIKKFTCENIFFLTAN